MSQVFRSVLSSRLATWCSLGRRTLAGLGSVGVILSLAGCYQPYYYQPPYPTYQGPAAPIQTLTPGQPYVPGQTPAGGLTPIPADNGSLGNPSPYFDSNSSGGSPNSTFSTPSNTNNNTQPYSPPAGNDNNFVPNYGDPNDDFLTPNIGPGEGGVQEFKIPSGEPQAMTFPEESSPLATASLEVESVEPVVPVIPSAPINDFGPVDVGPVDEPNPFGPQASAPTNANPTPASPTIAPIAQTGFDVPSIDLPEVASPTMAMPAADQFGHEEGAYGWLRGVVHQDPADGSWTITYDLAPGEFDNFAGHLTLAASGLLQGLADDDFVLIEGEVSPIQQDRFGKPVYEIRKLSKLQPTR